MALVLIAVGAVVVIVAMAAAVRRTDPMPHRSPSPDELQAWLDQLRRPVADDDPFQAERAAS